MKIIDTHCHPQFPQYDHDRDEIIWAALDSGIGMICVGTDLATSREAISLAERYEGLYASVGLHPNDATNDLRLTTYEELLDHPKVVAVGEVGLDYYRTTDPEKQKLQYRTLEQFVDLAVRHSKPLIIHCRDDSTTLTASAHADLLSILENSLSGVIHSFTGTTEQARHYIELGFYIGLNGIVTFSTEYESMVRSLPLDRILLETDAPYLAPAPYRGKRNQPSYVDIIGKSIAAIIGIEPEILFEDTTRNAKAIFSM